MIALHVAFNHLPGGISAYRLYPGLFYRSNQDPKPVFRNP